MDIERRPRATTIIKNFTLPPLAIAVIVVGLFGFLSGSFSSERLKAVSYGKNNNIVVESTKGDTMTFTSNGVRCAAKFSTTSGSYVFRDSKCEDGSTPSLKPSKVEYVFNFASLVFGGVVALIGVVLLALTLPSPLRETGAIIALLIVFILITIVAEIGVGTSIRYYESGDIITTNE
jgi:hypothetical protein